MEDVFCEKCGKEIVSNGIISGYGYQVKEDGTKVILCYECCGLIDRAEIEKCKPGDKYVLYLHYEKNGKYGDSYVCNWPNSLKYICGVKEGRHNIARVRYDVWFNDHLGREWHGVTYGNDTQICHCRLLKPKKEKK